MVEYTKIPEEYLGENYDKFFSLDTIKEKYGGNILKACEDHPAYHMYFLEGIKPRDYQLYALDMMVKHNFIFFLWARRLGKSTVIKGFDSWAMFWNKYPQGRERTTKILVIAHTNDSAESYIEEIRDMYEVGDRRVEALFKGKLGKKYFTSKFPKKTDNAKNNQSQLNIYNKGWNRIEAYPPTTRPRGRPASVINMDEIGFWCDYTTDEYRIYSEVVRPIITDQPNVKCFAATTPNGSTGLYYDLLPIDDHVTPYKLIWFPYWVRKDKTYLDEIKRIEEEYKAAGMYDAFRQEYLAELVNKSTAYFDKENEIDKVFENSNREMLMSYNGECQAGIDFGGNVKSRTVITISRYDKERDKIVRLYHKRYEVGKDSTLKEDIIEIATRFPNIVKWHVDSQGGGSSFYAWFKETFGSHMIDEITFRGRKADMYRLFKIACYKGRIESYYDPILRDEMLNFTADLKPSKHSTDDLLDSFLMSAIEWLEEKQKIKYGVIKY